MNVGYDLICPGCEKQFLAKIAAEPTNGTKFYFHCPNCHLPITGSMTGEAIENHRLRFDCRVVGGGTAESLDQPAVTINPFVPAKKSTTMYDMVGRFPTMTLMILLGEKSLLEYKKRRTESYIASVKEWPAVRKLFHYYFNGDHKHFDKIAKEICSDYELNKLTYGRVEFAYMALSVTGEISGQYKDDLGIIFTRFQRKNEAALKKSSKYIDLIFGKREETKELERNIFSTLDAFVRQRECWEAGILSSFITPQSRDHFEELILFRDEFPILRDLYQQGFEISCKSLWIFVAAQNAAKRGDPDNFGNEHPASVPEKIRPNTLRQFEKLPNAHKISYVAQVPKWESLHTLLDSKQRNAIGHATASHNLDTGRVVSDKDKTGITYLTFLGNTIGVFKALSIIASAQSIFRIISDNFEEESSAISKT